MIVDGLSITIGYLRSHSALVDMNADVRPEIPPEPSRPTVKVFQLDAEDRTDGTDHLIAFRLQFDCYATTLGPAGLGEASLLTRTVRAALLGLPNASLTGARVTAVTFGVCPQLPDDAWEPARQRFCLEATVYAHGLPT